MTGASNGVMPAEVARADNDCRTANVAGTGKGGRQQQWQELVLVADQH